MIPTPKFPPKSKHQQRRKHLLIVIDTAKDPNASMSMSAAVFFVMNLVTHNLADYVAPFKNINTFVRSATKSIQINYFAVLK